MISRLTLLVFGISVLLATPASAEMQDALNKATRYIYKEVGDTKLPLYVFEPEGHKAEANAPAIVFFFGGGWTKGTPSQFVPQCEYLASRGMVAITVDYRVRSRHPVTVEDCIEDAKSAMRWVRVHAKQLGVHPERIAAAGGSAGGHLAACTAVIDDFDAESDNLEVSAKPNAMILFNPAMGKSIGANKSKITRGPVEKAVPFPYADKKQPPCIMFFGTNDRLLEGAEAYQSISQQAGNKCRIVTYEGQGHGFFNHGRSGNKYFERTRDEMDTFLGKLGWISAK